MSIVNKQQTAVDLRADWSEKNQSKQLAIVMISLNESHNMREVLENISDIADEIFLIDSYSVDDTVDIALEHNVHVVQRKFHGFGDQWNFALTALPITASWTMKLDPDERLTDELKSSIRNVISVGKYDGYSLTRVLWFMGRPIHVRQKITRIWRTGKCRFSDVLVNEHPIIDGSVGTLSGIMEHRDSPNLQHWIAKQNNYTTAEAIAAYQGAKLSALPRLFGNSLERRMFLKSLYWQLPFRHLLMYLFCLIVQGSWRAGKPGFIWARQRASIYQLCEDKLYEMQLAGKIYDIHQTTDGVNREGIKQSE